MVNSCGLETKILIMPNFEFFYSSRRSEEKDLTSFLRYAIKIFSSVDNFQLLLVRPELLSTPPPRFDIISVFLCEKFFCLIICLVSVSWNRLKFWLSFESCKLKATLCSYFLGIIFHGNLGGWNLPISNKKHSWGRKVNNVLAGLQ